MHSTARSALTSLLTSLGVKSTQSVDWPATRSWRRIYWLYAAIIPATLYLFEAIKILLYHVARAPNASLGAQLSVTFLFYGLWLLAPRLCWAATKRAAEDKTTHWQSTALLLGGLGIAFSAVHLLLLTIMRLTMFATAPWQWQPIHILHAYGEVWLNSAGLWLVAYLVTAAVILLALFDARPTTPAPMRYEVRENGKTLLIPVADIFWIKAAGNYAELHTASGVTMVRKTLGEVASEMGGGFLRSHRSALINNRHVVSIKSLDASSGFVVLLSNGDEAPLSRRRLSAFKAVLKSER